MPMPRPILVCVVEMFFGVPSAYPRSGKNHACLDDLLRNRCSALGLQGGAIAHCPMSCIKLKNQYKLLPGLTFWV